MCALALFGDGQSAHKIVRILGEDRLLIKKQDNRVEQTFMDTV